MRSLKRAHKLVTLQMTITPGRIIKIRCNLACGTILYAIYYVNYMIIERLLAPLHAKLNFMFNVLVPCSKSMARHCMIFCIDAMNMLINKF